MTVFGGCDRWKTWKNSNRSSSHPAHPAAGRVAKLAIILDDVASDASARDDIFKLPQQITLAILPDHPQATAMAQEAHDRGFGVMLHLPMQSEANERPEPRQIHVGMSPQELSEMLSEMLENVPHAEGVNNHQGSRATSDAKLMEELMPLLRQRNLFFIDSRTTAATLAYEVAQRDGVNSGFRNVPFLDDLQEESAIRQRLQRAIHGAKEKGEAIVIGHPHAETLRVLREMLPMVQAQGVELVHASALVHSSGH